MMLSIFLVFATCKSSIVQASRPNACHPHALWEDLDDNELAAQALEAELADEPELSAKLNAILVPLFP
eukprot:728698-Amphidinium_carterae.1